MSLPMFGNGWGFFKNRTRKPRRVMCKKMVIHYLVLKVQLSMCTKTKFPKPKGQIN